MIPRYYLIALVLGLILLGSGCADADVARPDEAVATQVEHQRPDWVADAVIYELFVTDFTSEGTFRAVIPRLQELKALGVNTIWLMPIHPIGEERRKGDLGSPYAIRDYYAVNPAYGTKEDFKALVDAVHEQDMYIIIDFVANHTAWDHPWTVEHPDWYTKGEDGGITVPINPEGQPTDWTDVADLNYDNPALRAEMINVMRYWVEAFDIDGYRCDVAGWVPYDFWEEAISTLREIKPVLMLAEASDPELHRVGFDVTYAWPFYGELKEVWRGEPVSELVDQLEATQDALPEGALRLRFTTNHDETAWDAPPPVLFGGLEGARAASVLAYAVPGVPLLYNGQEVGVGQNVSFFQKTEYDWSQHPEMRAFYTDLLAFYHRSEALRNGVMTVLAPEEDDVLFLERSADNDRLLVAVNVRDTREAVSVPDRLRNASVEDVFSGEAFVLGDSLVLPGYGYRLLQAE